MDKVQESGKELLKAKPEMSELVSPKIKDLSKKNSVKEGREFAARCAATQDWLEEMEALLAKRLVISADRNTLMDQVAEFEPIYKEIMSKEHDIIMVLNRGKDVMTRSSKANASNIKKNWMP